VTSAVAQANIRKSFRILIIAAPLQTRQFANFVSRLLKPAGNRSRWEIPPTDSKTLNGRSGSRPSELDFVLFLFSTIILPVLGGRILGTGRVYPSAAGVKIVVAGFGI
jgi:hypothetical protein